LDELLERDEPRLTANTLEADVLEPAAPRDVEVVSEVAAPYESVAAPTNAEEADSAQGEVTDVDVMLSMLAAEHRMTDPAADLAERLGDRSTRITVMVGGTILIAGLGFLVLTVLGAIF
jgi:hypothetical protein